jgi:hypothetical protein
MPRVHVRKAAKDYPREGIKKGDTYYYTKLKLQRGGIEKRSLKPFKPSELTTSPFKGGYLAVQEGWDASEKTADDIRAAAEAIRDLGTEAQGSFDNMPEGLQQGETGQMIEARATACEEKADGLDSLADELEGLDEPVEPLGDLETDEENEEAQSEYDDAVSEYESEIERITGEADDLISDMPE